MRRSTELRTHWRRWAGVRLALFCLLVLAACAPATGLGLPTDGPAREPTLRVGLAVDTTSVILQATTQLEILNGISRELIGAVPTGQAVTVTADQMGNLVVTGPWGDRPGAGMIIARATDDGFVRMAGKPYRGTGVVRAASPGRLTVINDVDMENYLLGVVPFEIGRVGPELLEAAKAQAIAARTYAYRYMGRREALGFDVYASTEDQVYGGAEGEHGPVSQAVLETAGQILTYDGQPIEAFYHSTCAGQTAAIQDVWPAEMPRPYLVSVVDVNPATGLAFDSVSSRFRWTQRWTADELNGILSRTLADSLPPGVTSVGQVRDIQITGRSESGRISRMQIITSTATFDLGGDRIRWIFLTPAGPILNSSKFDVTLEKDAQGMVTAVIANGGGWGHGVGMCQVGAMGRARAGQDYRTILGAYYPNTTLVRLY